MKLNIPDKSYSAIIFDCDGTLADTMPLHFKAWQEAFREYGTPFIFDEREFYRLGGVSTVKIVELFNQRYHTTIDAHALAQFKETLFLKIMNEVDPIPAVVAVAREYHSQGKPLAVASGGMRPIVLRTLDLLGITGLFSTIVTPEDVVHGKPAPDLFLLAAARLDALPEECLVFEDTPTGVSAAVAAGMDYVLVPCHTTDSQITEPA